MNGIHILCSACRERKMHQWCTRTKEWLENCLHIINKRRLKSVNWEESLISGLLFPRLFILPLIKLKRASVFSAQKNWVTFVCVLFCHVWHTLPFATILHHGMMIFFSCIVMCSVSLFAAIRSREVMCALSVSLCARYYLVLVCSAELLNIPLFSFFAFAKEKS